VSGTFDGVKIWTMALDTIPEPLWLRLFAILDPAERERSQRFVFERHRRQYMAAHALTRVVLTAAGGGAMAPADWRFETGIHGKPRIAGAKGPYFNLSHCEGAVACAVSHETEVGVDVEFLNRQAPTEIAETHFADGERVWLLQQAEELRSIGFFRLWTLKEAFIKATGQGLSQRLGDFAFAFEPLRVTFADPALGDAATWRFEQQLIGSQRHIAAAAWQEGALRLRAEWETVGPNTLLCHVT
jgi:4'-phosphopantetheinyl transferase